MNKRMLAVNVLFIFVEQEVETGKGMGGKRESKLTFALFN